MEKRWKAGEFSAIKRAGEYYEAAFHARLAQKVAALGYAVGRSGEWWEIQGVSRDVLEKFSQRTEKIEETAREQGISDALAKEKLGALTREKKVKTSLTELKQEWSERLTVEEKRALSDLLGHQQSQVVTPRESMDYALAHCHERSSVVTDKALVTEALWHGIGHVGVEQVERQLYRDDILVKEMEGQRWCTTREVLSEEVENIQFVQKGFGQSRPLNAKAYTFQNDQLGQDQKDAVRHVMTSPDRVIAIRGPAGAGKTTMMREAVPAIEAGGRKVFTFAPSAESSRGTLRDEGFSNAQTVAHLLKNESMHPQLRGQVLWIDEAGLLSARQMRGIFQLAEQQNCRVILSGDTRQHTSVERGDALRLLETYAGLKPAELTETSHVAQSKTVDRVFVAQSIESFGASSTEQFFVSISRARESVTVYTDNKVRLAETIQSSGVRMTAHELLKLRAPTERDDPLDSILRDKRIVPFCEETAIKSTSQKTKPARKAVNIEAAQPWHQYRNPYFARSTAQKHNMGL